MLHVSYLKTGERQILVETAGELTLGSSMSKMRQALDVVIGFYGEAIVDISRITYMDPAGLELLVLAWAYAESLQTRLTLRGVDVSSIGLAQRVKLIAVFEGDGHDYLRAA
jgi:anti-anti-sigma regulatory factor